MAITTLALDIEYNQLAIITFMIHKCNQTTLFIDIFYC